MSNSFDNSVAYELLTQEIYQQMLHAEGIQSIEVKHNTDIEGRSGVKHQIDVYWYFKQAGVDHRVLVECKHYNSAIELGLVRNFFGAVHDIGAKGVMVTVIGYQSGAKKFAEAYNIDLKLVGKPTEKDWVGRVRTIVLRFTAKFVKDRMLTVHFDINPENPSHFDGATAAREPLNLQLVDRQGNPVTSELRTWLPEQLDLLDKPPGGPYQQILQGDGRYVPMRSKDGAPLLAPIKTLAVTYHVSESTEERTLSGDAIVDAILKDFKTGEIEHVHRKGD